MRLHKPVEIGCVASKPVAILRNPVQEIIKEILW
jgi:hypothetical protein